MAVTPVSAGHGGRWGPQRTNTGQHVNQNPRRTVGGRGRASLIPWASPGIWHLRPTKTGFILPAGLWCTILRRSTRMATRWGWGHGPCCRARAARLACAVCLKKQLVLAQVPKHSGWSDEPGAWRNVCGGVGVLMSAFWCSRSTAGRFASQQWKCLIGGTSCSSGVAAGAPPAAFTSSNDGS